MPKRPELKLSNEEFKEAFAITKPKGKPNNVHLRLRLPRALHKAAKEEARENCRSLNSQIIWYILQHMGQ